MSSLFTKVASTASTLAIVTVAMGSSLTALAMSEFAMHAGELADAGVITTQSSEAGYRLGDNITRAELAKIAVNLSGETATTCAGDVFKDVTSAMGDLCGYVEAAAEAGIVSKANSNFRPTDLVTRAEMIKMLLASQGVAPTDVSAGFSDVTASMGDLAGYINAAVEEGLIKSGTSFRPNATATRGEAFKVAAGAMALDAVVEPPVVVPPTTSTGVVVGTTTPTATGDVMVSLNPATPAATTLATGSAYNKVLVVDMKAGSKDAAITGIEVTRTGLLSNSNVAGISVWVDGSRLGNVAQSLTSDGKATVTFGSTPLAIAAGATKTVTIALNVKTGEYSGTVGLTLSKVMAGGTVTGAPVTSAVHSVVDGSQALVKYSVSAISSGGALSDDPLSAVPSLGTGQSTELAKFKVEQKNSKEDLKVEGMNVFIEGSVADGDLDTLQVVSQEGNVLASAATTVGRYVNFKFTAPYVIPQGSSRFFTVKASVAAGKYNSNRTFSAKIRDDFDVVAMGAVTGTYVLATSFSPTTQYWFKVREGTVTVAKATDSRSQSAAPGIDDVVLGTFDVKASGEDMEFQKLNFKVSKVGGFAPTISTTNATTTVTTATTANLAAGMSIVSANLPAGTTIASITNATTFVVSAAATATAAGTASTITSNTNLRGTLKMTVDGVTVFSTDAATADNYTTTGANSGYLSTYFTVKAGSTAKVAIVASIATTATLADSYRADLIDASYKLISSNSIKTLTLTGTNGNTIAVERVSLTASSNGAFAASTLVKGQTNAKIGSFNLQASNADDLNVTTVRVGLNTASVTGMNNLTLKMGTTTIASAIANPTLTGNTFSINGGALKVSANSTVTIDVYADVTSAATAPSVQAQLEANGTSAVGVKTSVSVTGPAALASSAVTSIVGNGTLTVESDSLTPAKQILVAGMTNVEVLRFKVRADNKEDIRLDKLDIGVAVGNTATLDNSLVNVKLFDGATQVGGGSVTFVDGVAKFTGLNFVVPKAGSKSLSLRADTTGSAVLSKGMTLQVAPVGMEYTGVAGGSLTAFAAVANTVAPSATMLLQDVKLVIASQAVAASGKSTAQDLASYTLKAEGARDATVSKIVVLLTTSNATGSILAPVLRYNNTNYETGSVSTAANVTTVTFTLATPITVTAGTTVSFGVRADTTALSVVANQGSAHSISPSIAGVSGVVHASNGIEYSYTDANAVASGTINTSDSYPANAPTIQY